jgi:hypothetical protein
MGLSSFLVKNKVKARIHDVYDLIESTLNRVGEQLSDRLSPSLGYAGVSSSNAECYRNRAEGLLSQGSHRRGC